MREDINTIPYEEAPRRYSAGIYQSTPPFHLALPKPDSRCDCPDLPDPTTRILPQLWYCICLTTILRIRIFAETLYHLSLTMP